MVYYLLLILASLLFGAQFMAVKAYEKLGGQGVNASAKFSAVSCLFAFFIFFFANGCRLQFSTFSVVVALLFAAVGIACNIAGLKTLALGDIAVYSLFMMLGGMMVPFLYGVVFLKEPISGWGIAGLVLLTVALVLPVFGKKKGKGNALFYVLCVALFVLNGLSSTLSKIHQVDGRGVGTLDFTVLIFGIQCVLAGAVWLTTKLFAKKKPPVPVPAEGESDAAKHLKKMIVGTLLCGLFFAAMNGTAPFLQVLSAKYVNATAQYPIITGGTLVFSAILGRIIYKEKLSKLKILQIAVSCVATVLFVF